jgi:hypothetical protein
MQYRPDKPGSPTLLDATISDPPESIGGIPDSDLPDIIYHVKLQPSFRIVSSQDELVDTVDVQDLAARVKNVILGRISDDYKNIISQTLSYQFDVSAYNYDGDDNVISMDFIVRPEDIKSRWVPLSEGTPVPPSRGDLISNIRSDIMDQIEYLYGDAASDTWKRGELNYYTDANNNRYDVDLKLLSTQDFVDWSLVRKRGRIEGSTNRPGAIVQEDDLEPENQNGGSRRGPYYKYMVYKTKYLSLKRRISSYKNR